jgi:hypothetical protein
MVPPKSLTVERNPPAGAAASSTEPESVTVHRPVIGYPEVLFTEFGATAAHRDALVAEYVARAAAIRPGSGDVAGVPDPDVDHVRISVEVRSPAHDIAGPDGTLDGTFRVIYQTERALLPLSDEPIASDPGLSIDLAYVDAASINDWAPNGWPSVGPLVVPRARDVHLRFEPLVRDDAAYFGAGASRGLTTTIAVRAEARDEPALLVQDTQRDEPVRGYLFRRPSGLAAPAVTTQLAQSLRLLDDGLTLTAPPGQRVLFGASKGLRQTISADGGVITFAAESELLRHWLVAIVVDLDRDWTWDGLGGPITVERNGETVGTLSVPRTVSPTAVADPANWQRARSRLVFFDTVDPHELTASGFPEALLHTWIVKTTTIAEAGPVVGVAGAPTLVAGMLPEPPQPEVGSTPLSLTLPIAIAPKQVPQLVSVGTALSPYRVGDGYASTGRRERALWLELAEPIANPAGEALFARVVGHGADPLLCDPTPSADQPFEPPLSLDPELMRLITSLDSDDRAGLDAMTLLEKALDSDVHYLLRVPDWLDPDDPELFGFWTYELRVGHAGDPHAPHQEWWSTAQGRYGRPLRVTGVQHPAPGLVCHAGRMTINAVSFIEATAPFATAVLNSQPLVAPFDQPTTTICFLLYAQVVQADGSTNRNVLLDHRYATFEPRRNIAGDVVLGTVQRDRIGRAAFPQQEVDTILKRLGLHTQTPLSMLAVELLPGGVDGHLPKDLRQPEAAVNGQRDPLGDALRHGGRPQRILRVSPLLPIATAC